MSKTSSAKHHQITKEKVHKKLVKDIKIFLKKKNKKRGNMILLLQKSLRG